MVTCGARGRYAQGVTGGLIPIVDAALAQMKKGEKRTLIVPAEPAYGRNGFYAKQRPNEKRFVIAPFSMLVYEIEVLDIKPPAASK